MRHNTLGHSNLKVSALCLGTMMFGDQTARDEAASIVADAHSQGVNYIDTADVYTKGASELMVGELLQGQRHDWVLATKLGNRMTERVNEGHYSRSWMLRAGKIRYWGVSNFRGWRIAEAVRVAQQLGMPAPVVCQPYYNLLNRQPEVEVLPACAHYGIGITPYSPVARGVLTGKYPPGQPAPEGTRAGRGDKRIAQTEFREESLVIAQALQKHARAQGISLVHPGHPSTPGYTDPAYPLNGRVRKSAV
ncbi:MAG: aldo/keto reductase [Burkholderiaceae bacterium]